MTPRQVLPPVLSILLLTMGAVVRAQPPGGPGGFPGGPDAGPELGLVDRFDDGGKPLRSGLLGVARLREQYLAHIRSIATDQLAWESIGPVIEQCRDLIHEAVVEDTRKLASTAAFEAATSSEVEAATDGQSPSLRHFIERRRRYLLDYQPPPSPAR